MPAIPSQTRVLAIVMPSWIGDTVMATPVLRAIRAALPKAKIVGVMRPGLDEILRGSPWLDEMIVCNMKGAFGPMRLGRAIHGAKADAAMLLPNSFRSALGMRLSGVRNRIGYSTDGRGWLLSHRLNLDHQPQDRPIPMVEYYAVLAEWALGVGPIDRRIELAVTDSEKAAADQLLAGVQQPFALLNPGANRTDKRWPAERFAQLADTLAAKHQLAIVMSGGPAESGVLEAVRSAAKTSITNLAERGVRLGSLKAVIQRAAVVITNDTGPRHIAAAVGTPVVTLFGPTDHRWTTLAGVREKVLLAEPFLPEELMADKQPKTCAIEKIAVGDVVAAVDSLLANLPTK